MVRCRSKVEEGGGNGEEVAVWGKETDVVLDYLLLLDLDSGELS
jgi:hypothetical protein